MLYECSSSSRRVLNMSHDKQSNLSLRQEFDAAPFKCESARPSNEVRSSQVRPHQLVNLSSADSEKHLVASSTNLSAIVISVDSFVSQLLARPGILRQVFFSLKAALPGSASRGPGTPSHLA